jgi:hypothetical protein
MAVSRNVASLVKRLQPGTSCDAADALVKLGIPSGGFLPGLKAHSPSYLSTKVKIIAPVQTIKFERNDQKGNKPEIVGHYVSLFGQPNIVVLS